jgi:hypothetical protein
MIWRTCIATAWIVAFVAACDKTPEPTTAAPPHPASPAAPAAPAEAPSAAANAAPRGPTDVAYDVPGTWQKSDTPNPMRKATYRIPKSEGDPEDAEMSVTQFGGTVEMNVKRWSDQFEQSKDDKSSRQERKVGDLKVTVVEIHGTFKGGGMPGAAPSAPKPKWGLLGAVVETEGNLTFFKLTGPEKTINDAKPGFDKMVESLRGK